MCGKSAKGLHLHSIAVCTVGLCIMHGRRKRGQGATAAPPPPLESGKVPPHLWTFFDFQSRPPPHFKIASFAYVYGEIVSILYWGIFRDAHTHIQIHIHTDTHVLHARMQHTHTHTHTHTYWTSNVRTMTLSQIRPWLTIQVCWRTDHVWTCLTVNIRWCLAEIQIPSTWDFYRLSDMYT